MTIVTLGIDLGKNSCSVVGLSGVGAVVLRKRIQRFRLFEFLSKVSKRGNSYLRKLFIHGARAVLHLIKDRTPPLARWVDQLARRTHGNVATVAMANKLARIAWAVLRKGKEFDQAVLIGK